MYNLETFQQKIDDLNKNLTILKFDGVKKPVEFKCNKCGLIIKLNKGETLLTKTRSHCPHCKTANKKTIEMKHKIDNLLKNNLNIELIDFVDCGTPIKFHCKVCNKYFNREPYRFLKNQKCPSCSGTTLKTFDRVMLEIKEIHGDDYEVLNPDKYENTRTHLKIRHKCGFIWESTLHNLKIHNCPKCCRKISKGEKRIKEYLEGCNIEYIWQYKQKIDNHTLFFDFYLPKQNLFIEFQGQQHYDPIDYFGGIIGFEKRQELDNLKKQWCKENNYTLLEISYRQFDKIEEILKGSTTS